MQVETLEQRVVQGLCLHLRFAASAHRAGLATSRDGGVVLLVVGRGLGRAKSIDLASRMV